MSMNKRARKILQSNYICGISLFIHLYSSGKQTSINKSDKKYKRNIIFVAFRCLYIA